MTILEKDAYTAADAIAWVWGDLAVTALVHASDDQLAEEIACDLEAEDILLHVEKLLCSEDDSAGFVCRAHWTSAMDDNLASLFALLTSSRLQNFKAEPTLQLYRSLTRKSPHIQTALLDIVRRKVADNLNSRKVAISWSCAESIFRIANQTKDLLEMDLVMPKMGLDREPMEIRMKIALYLSYQSQALQLAGLRIVEEGIRCELQSCWLIVEAAFPGWDMAWRWLSRQLERGIVKKTPSAFANAEELAQRRKKLEEFAEILWLGVKRQTIALASRADYAGGRHSTGKRPAHRLESWGITEYAKIWMEMFETWPESPNKSLKVSEVVRSLLDADQTLDVEGLTDAIRRVGSVLGDKRIADGMQILYDLLSGRSVQDISTSIDPDRAAKRKRVDPIF